MILTNLLVRTLVGYDHVAGAGRQHARAGRGDGRARADRRRPHLHVPHQARRQVRAARRPAGHLDRTSLYSFERLANPKDGAEYSLLLLADRGLHAFAQGKAKTIAASGRPNASTIVFHLTAPTGDFLYRLAMPRDGADPAEVARCFEGQPGKYGKDIVSTGPYMIEGADKVDDPRAPTSSR